MTPQEAAYKMQLHFSAMAETERMNIQHHKALASYYEEMEKRANHVRGRRRWVDVSAIRLIEGRLYLVRRLRTIQYRSSSCAKRVTRRYTTGAPTIALWKRDGGGWEEQGKLNRLTEFPGDVSIQVAV